MIVFTCFTTVGLVRTENMEFLDCHPSGLFNGRVLVLWLVMFSYNGMQHIIDTRHR